MIISKRKWLGRRTIVILISFMYIFWTFLSNEWKAKIFRNYCLDLTMEKLSRTSRSTIFFLANNRMGKRKFNDRVSHLLNQMCQSWSSHFSVDDVISAAIDSNSHFGVAVGVEVWRPEIASEIFETFGASLPPFCQSRNRYHLLDHQIPTSPPKVFIGANPRDSGLMNRARKRLNHINFTEYEFIDFGGAEEMRDKLSWIHRHVYRDYNLATFCFHDLATTTGFLFVEILSNSADLEEALYLETDFIPVFRFRDKFDSFMMQLRSNTPNYDIAFLGTCCGLEDTVSESQRISENIYKSHTSRCYNALVMKRSAAKKIMAYGALQEDVPYAIDLIFDRLIEKIPLNVVWANEPLVFEENKVQRKFLCL